MKKLIVSGIILTACLQEGFSQTEWQNQYRSSELEINYSYAECHDQVNDIHKRLLVFQFVNLTGNKINVSYDKQMWYGDKCVGCDRSPEHQFTLELDPNKTVTGSCENKKDKALYIVDKMLNVKSSSLAKFELANIIVSKAE